MILNELGPDRGPNPEMAEAYRVSLIAAAPNEAVPQGVALADILLPSLDTDEVKNWLSENSGFSVFVAAGKDLASEGTPSLAVYVTKHEYEAVAAAMPR